MKNIFVGNLDFVLRRIVASLFAEYGTVDRVSIVTDRDTGRSRGFAFVEMPEASEPIGHYALNGFSRAVVHST